MKTLFAAMIAAGLALAPAAMAQDAATSAKSKSANKTVKKTNARYRPSARASSYSGPPVRQEVSPEIGNDHTRM